MRILLLLSFPTFVFAELKPQPGFWRWLDGDWTSNVEWNTDGTFKRVRDGNMGTWKASNGGVAITVEIDGERPTVQSTAESTSTRMAFILHDGRELILTPVPRPTSFDVMKLEGTWTQTSRDDASIQEKSFHNGQWQVTTRDAHTRDITWWCGGSYQLEDGHYIETISYCSDAEWDMIGVTQDHRLSIKGNGLVQVLIENGYRESYWRNNAPATLPTDHVVERRLAEFTGTWVHLGTGDSAERFTPSSQHGLSLAKDGTFAWQLKKRPSIVKGAWTLTQASSSADLVLHLRIDVAGIGTKLIKGQVLRWRADLRDGNLTLVSLDGEESGLYTSLAAFSVQQARK